MNDITPDERLFAWRVINAIGAKADPTAPRPMMPSGAWAADSITPTIHKIVSGELRSTMLDAVAPREEYPTGALQLQRLIDLYGPPADARPTKE